MKRTKLLVLPLVTLLASCGSNQAAGYNTTVRLPAGGQKVTATEKKDDQEVVTEEYAGYLKEMIYGIDNTVRQNSYKVSLEFDVKAQNINQGEGLKKMSLAFNGQVDAYVAKPATEEGYASAMIELKNLSFNLANFAQSNYSADGSVERNYLNLKIDGLKNVKLYYTVDKEEAYVLADLSDPSVKSTVMSVLNQATEEMTEEQVDAMLDMFLGKTRKCYAKVAEIMELIGSGENQIIEEGNEEEGRALRLEDTEPTEEEEKPELPADLLGYGISYLLQMYEEQVSPMLLGLAPTAAQMLPSVGIVPDMQVYKEGENVNGIGLEYNANVKKLIEQFSKQEPTTKMSVPATGEEGEGSNVPEFEKFNAGVAVLVGNTHGSEPHTLANEEVEKYALEEVNLKADASMKDYGSFCGAITLGMFYNQQAQFQVPAVTEFPNNVIDAISGMMGALVK